MQKYLPVWFQLKEIKSESKNTIISSLAPKVLTKKEDVEKVQPYLDKLTDTINAKGINNIALTGGYGSGKSTILKTFQHHNEKNYTFLNISLAAFNKTKEEDKYKELYKKLKIGNSEELNDVEKEKELTKKFKENFINNEELERQLEISILQQIVYKVKPSNLPESRFKRIVNIPNWKLWGLIPIAFILWVSSILLLFKYNYLDRLNPNMWSYKFKDIDWNTNLIFLFAFLGIGYFSKLVVELFSNSKINKVNLKGEIEIGDNSNKSILNEHYDEILYYFEKNPFNVVVIEDLDRFDNTSIFSKLRELNILLNNAETIKNKKAYKKFGIKFLYAIGDDFFDDKKERVKFFEYIIPIIPFINSSNAYEQLMSLIRETDLDDNIFSKEFLSDVTIFIDDIDMRLLTNIFHEFVIYRNTLKPEFINKPEELFAIITYKNIDPEDFNKLNNKRGKLYNLINGKKKYVQKFIKKIEDDIQVKNKIIENIKNENLSNLEELKSVYLSKVLSKLPEHGTISINTLLENETFEDIITNGNLQYEKYNFYSSPYYTRATPKLKFEFSDIENEVNKNFKYIERVELIESKNSNKIDLLQIEIENLKTKKSEITSWELKQIFEEIDLNQYIDNFSNNGLLRNFILNGYINENYNDYISLFHGVNLDKEDFQFKKNVLGKFHTDFFFKLSKIENLVDDIDERHFRTDFILNYNLLIFLGENYPKYFVKYDTIIKHLTNEKQRSIEFIDGYIGLNSYITKEYLIETFGKQNLDDESIKLINKKSEKQLNLFIDKLTKHWSGFWEYIYLKSNYPEDKVNKYLELILKFSKVETIINGKNNVLKEAIELNPAFLSLIKNTDELNYLDKIIEILNGLNIVFKKLDNPNIETTELFDYVYNNNHYELNNENLPQMLLNYGDNNFVDTFESSNYSTIKKSNCKPLIEYVNSNINTYVEDVYLRLEQNKSETEESIVELLNNVNLDIKLKTKIIQKTETIITDLSNIENIEIKKQLLINNKITTNWENIIDYYVDCENKIDENLIGYFNLKDISSILSKLKISKDDIKFEINMLVCNEINDDIYIELLNSCYFRYPKLGFEHLNEKKVINLINILTTTKSNYDILRENFADNHIILIEKDFKAFLENIDDFETDEDDILILLKSEKITIDNRLSYISKLNEQTIIDNKEIAKKVGEIIINKSTKIKFEFNTIESIVKSLDPTENKVKLVNLYFTELSNENIINLVKNMSYNHSELFVKQHKPLFNDNTFNRELLTKLESKGFINSFDTDKKDVTKLRAVANY